MAHEIAVINGRAAMAYVNETPWHGLGTKVEGAMDVQAALEAANLNWDVELRTMFFRKNDKQFRVPNKQAVVRETDNAVLGVVGGDYELIQNSEAFGVLNVACEQFGVTIETAGALGKGDRVWMLAKMPNSIEVVAGDRVDGYFLISNGHNGWTTYVAKPTPVRVVCANTLGSALKGEGMIKLRHVASETEKLDLVADLVTSFIADLEENRKLYAGLASKKMTLEEMRDYVNAVLDVHGVPNKLEAKKAAAIIDLTANGKGVEFAAGTAWAAYNAVTEFADHVRIGAKSPKTLKAADQSAIFGPYAKMKAKALKLALAA